MNEPLFDEALSWSRKPGLQRLMRGLVEKFRSLGRAGGSVCLRDLDEEECRALKGLFPRDRFVVGGDARVRFERFAGEIERSKFAELGWRGVLEVFQGAPLESKADREARERQALAGMVERAYAARPSAAGRAWCEQLLQGGAQVKGVLSSWREEGFEQRLQRVFAALAELPERPLRLPVFAARVCGDPHGLDLDCGEGKHLLAALAFLAERDRPEERQGRPRRGVEYHTELLAGFNLVRDDIANFVTVAGLLAFRAGAVSPMWRAMADERGVINLPLRELERLDRVTPAWGEVAWVVENSTVYAALLDRFERAAGEAGPYPALICTHGQFKLAGLRLLDRLLEAGVEVRYSGDLDPEGLLMADRLLSRGSGRVRAWRMDEALYRDRGGVVTLDEGRLQKLEQVRDPGLLRLAGLMRARGFAVYQEDLLELLTADLVAAAEGVRRGSSGGRA